MIAPSIRITRGPGMHITEYRFEQIMDRFSEHDTMAYELPFTYTATQERVWKDHIPLGAVRLLLEIGIVPLMDHLETL
jgi:hypothetical protein